MTLPTQSELQKHYSYEPTTGQLIKKSGIRPGPLKSLSGEFGTTACRLAWKLQTGRDPEGDIVRIDGDSANLKWNNLREGKRNHVADNIWTTNTSGHRGVSRAGNKWRAYITHNRKQINLGRFGTPEEAAQARQAAESQHGYIRQNNP